MNQIVTVRCKRIFLDLQRDQMVNADEEWQVTRRRAEVLQDLGVIDIIEE